MPARGRGRWSEAFTDEDYKRMIRERVKVTDAGCWVWQGAVQTQGYGLRSYRGKYWRTHRLAYYLWKGDIPKGMDVCHTCDVRLCINPDHLWVGTRSENMLDASYKRKWPHQAAPTCEHGHPRTPENVYMYMGRQQKCRVCIRAKMRLKAGWPTELAWNAPAGFKRTGKGEGT